MAKASSFIPLIITLLLAVVAAGVGFVIYSIITSISDTTSKKMEKHNISMSRDGMKVGVKEVNHEAYKDRTQGVLMNVWNNASWPAYSSKLGWGQKPEEKKSGWSSSRKSTPSQTPVQTPGVDSERRKPFSRHGSSQQKVSTA